MATVFVGGSALLLAGAMAALAFGFANGEDSLVWTALIASCAAALFLVVAYFVSKREMKQAAAQREPAADPGTSAVTEVRPRTQDEHESFSVVSAPPAPPEPQTEQAEQTAGEQEEGSSVAPAAAAMAAGSPTATKPSTAKKNSAPGTAAAAKPSSPSDVVVGIASKKKFHRPDCRYAKSESGEEMSRATARKRGFVPCGICKP